MMRGAGVPAWRRWPLLRGIDDAMCGRGKLIERMRPGDGRRVC